MLCNYTINMDNYQDNQESSLLLAHFYKNLINDNNLNDISLNLKIIDELLDAGLNINQKFPDNFLASSEPIVSGGTPLHFVYSREFSIEIFNALIEHDADFTLKNANGQTILHCMIVDLRHGKNSKCEKFINSVLSAHVKFQNISNPSDGNGLTHFHCACMANHTQAIEFFLENGVSIDHTVNMDSKSFPGYTGLHFAIEFFALEAIQILLDSRANIFAENKEGITPLEALIKDKQGSVEEMEECGFLKGIPKFIGKYDKPIGFFLERDHSLTSSFFYLYAACSLQDVSWIEEVLKQVPNINQSISMDSSNWPGYTPLHFAAHCSLDVVKFLLERGANIVAEDAHGVTPLNICFKYHLLEDVCSVLLNDSQWANILLSDGKTKLLDLMANMHTPSRFKSFLNDVLDDVNSIVPVDSPFWPGYTCLHVAIVISQSYKDEIIKMCLNYGPDVNVKNARGQTPIHLAYRLQKFVLPLLEHLQSLSEIVDILDEDDLSYLHIAAAYNNVNVIEKLLPTSDVNITYKGRYMEPWNENDRAVLYWRRAVTGWTPLHFAVRNSSNELIELMVDAGADVDAKDDYGLTPLHYWALSEKSSVDALFARDDLKDCVTEFGMSYLHVASALDNRAAVERLIALGSKIDGVMDEGDYSLGQPASYGFSGFTPLELALASQSYKAIVGLIKNGARMSSNDFECTKLLRNNYLFSPLCEAAWEDGEVQDVVEAELGLTKLHVACFHADARSVEVLLDQGAKVDAKVHAGSKVFAGCTPLHLLMMKKAFGYGCDDVRFVVQKIQMLLKRGTDVTIANVEGNTPVHLSLKLVEKMDWPVEEAEKCTTLLMAGQRDFTLNPVNAEGISHFHVACLVHDVEAVEEFLQSGVDVNQETDLFCEKYAKFTSLHFAFGYTLTGFSRNQSLWYIVDLLLKTGANVQAQDTRGNTPLHEACRVARVDIGVLANLINFGADVRKQNVHGETPFELLLSSPDVLPEQIRFFIKHGAQLNDSNHLSDKGYMGMFVLVNSAKPPKSIFDKIMRFSSDVTKDERGRTPIHNIVAISKTDNQVDLVSTYCEIINWFIKEGIDIDDQDKSGKTALHYAAQFGNTLALHALLEFGTDINITDKSGKPAFSYALERAIKMKKEVSTSEIFFMQVHVRKMIGLEVSELNLDLYNRLDVAGISTFIAQLHHYEDNYGPEIERSKSTIIGDTSFTVHDFLVDTKAVVNYPFMPMKIRDQINEYFNSLDEKKFSGTREIFVILKSQYNKAVARVSLIEEAARSLRAHLGFSFPGLCEDITMYLSNTELKNLIKSAN